MVMFLNNSEKQSLNNSQESKDFRHKDHFSWKFLDSEMSREEK